MKILIISIIIIIALNIICEYRSIYNINYLCYKIRKERKMFLKSIHYLPHSRCGISHHLIDIMQILLLSLVLKRKLKCITILIL